MALADIPSSGSANFETTCPAVLHTWRDAIDLRSVYDHTHPDYGVPYHTIAANRTSLGTGALDGVIGTTEDRHSFYLWNSPVVKWRCISMDYIELEVFT